VGSGRGGLKRKYFQIAQSEEKKIKKEVCQRKAPVYRNRGKGKADQERQRELIAKRASIRSVRKRKRKETKKSAMGRERLIVVHERRGNEPPSPTALLLPYSEDPEQRSFEK